MDLQEVYSAWAADAPGAINSSGLGGGHGSTSAVDDLDL